VGERILIVEDDRSLARVLRDNLTCEGFQVEAADRLGVASHLAQTFNPDLILLDLMLPDGNGLEVCQALSQCGKVPVIIITARGQKIDKLRGLSAGADDYVTKPFDLEELLARIKAVLRRANPLFHRLTLGDVTVDFATLTATKGAYPLQLTSREFDILRYLAERRGRVVSRDTLLRDIWGAPADLETRAVDNAIVRLRRKIESDPHSPQFIHTVHGDGYQLARDLPDAPPGRDSPS
jgi:two-component system, OmpR family, response regulator VicR